MNPKDRMEMAADDAASHIALVKTLMQAGILNQDQMLHYFEERLEAKKHVLAMSIALFISTEEDKVERDEMAEEMGYRNSFYLYEQALEALNYIPLSENDQKKLLEVYKGLVSK